MSNPLAIAPQATQELATSASAATAKALVEAKFTIALHRPRNIDDARVRILDACKRPAFAKAARWTKPVGGKNLIGPSIRFAEEAIRAMKNIDVHSSVVFEDNEKFIMHIVVLDLEANASYGDDVVIKKTVERRYADKDRIVLGERINSKGDKVYIVEATEDELSNKINAAKSKVIRNSGLRLVPQDIVDEAMELVAKVDAGSITDPAAEVKKVIDAFNSLRVKPSDLEQYLGHRVDQCNPEEISNLRMIYSTIKDGDATWQDYIHQQTEKRQPAEKKMDSLDSARVSQTESDDGSDVAEELINANVNFDKFVNYLKLNKLHPDPTSLGGYEDIPSAVWQKLSADSGKHIKKIIKSCGGE